MQIRVYYEDTDVGGIVYHTNYIKYCERARSQIFFDNGINLIEDKAHFVVKELEANFLKPAFLGDILEVKTQIVERKNVSLKLLQEIFKDDIKIFSMKIKLVYIKNNKAIKIPQHIKELFCYNSNKNRKIDE